MRALPLLAVLVLAPLTDAIAQQQPLQPGQRVRVTAPGLGIKKQVGMLEALDNNVLVVRADSTMRCPLANVTRLDVHRGRKSWGWWKGALIGFVGGAALGAFINASRSDVNDDCWDIGGKEMCAAIGAAVGGPVGFLVGTGIGIAIKTDRWEEVPLSRLRVSVVPQRDGRSALAISVSY